MTETTPTIRRVAAALLAATGALHLALVPEYLGEKAYVGVLFILGGLTAIAAAVALWRRSDPVTWAVGGLVCLGMGAGFILSRTTGLPGFHPHDWEASGLLSLLLEGGFLVALSTARPQLLRPSTA
jgi:hypothetical protein